jgi:hypothetical protein
VARFPLEVEEDKPDFSPLWRRFMTVCIATVAAESRAIVMVSDKAVSYSGSGAVIPLVSDTEAKKFLRIGDTHWYALIAGDPTFAFEVVKTAERTLAKQIDKQLSDSVGGMMYCVRAAYRKQREASVEEQILRPRLLNKNLVVARPMTMQPLTEDVFLAVITLAKDYKTKCSLLICGFDSHDKPHIFSVTDPGKCDLHDLTGFFAVGIGATTAISRLLILETKKKDSLVLSLYQSFEAKVNAEVVEDVGYNWDAEILVPGIRAIPVPRGIIRTIEKAYEDFPLTPFVPSRAFPRKTVSFSSDRGTTKQLFDFADSVLARAKPKRPFRKSSSRKSKSKR